MRVPACIVISFALLGAACGGDATPTQPAATPKTVDVYTVASAFSPNLVTIAAGDSVRFNIVRAPDGDGHDVTFDARAGAPANIPVTTTGIITRGFTTRGTFHYNCFVHPGMNGDVIVQ